MGHPVDKQKLKKQDQINLLTHQDKHKRFGRAKIMFRFFFI